MAWAGVKVRVSAMVRARGQRARTVDATTRGAPPRSIPASAPASAPAPAPVSAPVSAAAPGTGPKEGRTEAVTIWQDGRHIFNRSKTSTKKENEKHKN